jgi:hypothetical protein
MLVPLRMPTPLSTLLARHRAPQISLTPLFGDADLYVAVNGLYATRTNHAYLSMSSIGMDEITVRNTDPAINGTLCDPSQGASVCSVNIGVFGFSVDDAFFVLVASTSNAILLSDGAAQAGQVNASDFQYFMFLVTNPNATTTITVTPLSGDPDIYVATGPNPDRYNATWRANSMGTDIVQITPTDVNACSTPCRYYIGVTGFASPATFTIRATSTVSAPSILSAGLPTVHNGGGGGLACPRGGGDRWGWFPPFFPLCPARTSVCSTRRRPFPSMRRACSRR